MMQTACGGTIHPDSPVYKAETHRSLEEITLNPAESARPLCPWRLCFNDRQSLRPLGFPHGKNSVLSIWTQGWAKRSQEPQRPGAGSWSFLGKQLGRVSQGSQTQPGNRPHAPVLGGGPLHRSTRPRTTGRSAHARVPEQPLERASATRCLSVTICQQDLLGQDSGILIELPGCGPQCWSDGPGGNKCHFHSGEYDYGSCKASFSFPSLSFNQRVRFRQKGMSSRH